MAMAAVAAGADGLLIECHPAPASALCGAAHAISPATLASIVRATELLAHVRERGYHVPPGPSCRPPSGATTAPS
ncbi:MAG TPA: hypothetical protein VG520_03390 [Candidatus Dormibacteraeota bacterium]|nr:hypothetical protein [Candidatus Dormibacteraeota bacterium]